MRRTLYYTEIRIVDAWHLYKSSGHSMRSRSSAGQVAVESETSANEHALDISEGSSLSQEYLKRGQGKRNSRTHSRRAIQELKIS